MTPDDVPDALVEKAARVLNDRAGGWDGDWAEFVPEARHALAAVLPEIQAQALREAAVEVLELGSVSGSGINVGARAASWLGRRAARLATTTEGSDV